MNLSFIPYYSISSGKERKEHFDYVFLIDVYRASSTIVVLADKGAKKIKVVSSLKEAYSEREKDPEVVLCGERDSVKPEAFDYGNDTCQMSQIDFNEKTCVITTSNGTRALRAYAYTSNNFYACSFLNLDACLNHVKQNKHKNILVLCAGNWGKFSLEDYLCASLLINGLRDLTTNINDDIRLAWEIGAYYKNNPGKLKTALTNTDHALNLKSQNKFEDVQFIIENLNAYDCLPKLE